MRNQILHLIGICVKKTKINPTFQQVVGFFMYFGFFFYLVLNAYFNTLYS